MAWVAPVAGAAGAMATGALQMYFQHLENKKAWHRYKKVLQRQLLWRALDATKAMEKTGIHRLALLGVSPAGGPGAQSIGGLAEGGASAADLIAGAMARRHDGVMSAEEKELHKLAVSQEREKEHGMWLDNQVRAIELARMYREEATPSTGFAMETDDPTINDLNAQGQANAAMKTSQGIEYSNKQVVPFAATGVEVGMQAFEKLKMDSEGYVYLLPADSQDIEENAYLKAIYYARQGKRWAKGVIAKNMSKYRKLINRVFPAPKGMVYVFRRASGQFQLVPYEQFKSEVREKYKRKRVIDRRRYQRDSYEHGP